MSHDDAPQPAERKRSQTGRQLGTCTQIFLYTICEKKDYININNETKKLK